MSKASMHSFELGRARSPAPMIDKCAIIPILACVYAVIVAPLVVFFTDTIWSVPGIMETHSENKIVWPAMAAISVIFAARNLSRRGRVIWAPHIICLLAYLAFAGASVLWAFSPELSFMRYVQQVMVVTSVVLPAMVLPAMKVRTVDLMRGLFLCFALASILNVFFVLDYPPKMAEYDSKMVIIGYPGYFGGKNYLGECAAVALLLSLHEMLYPGRRALGFIVVVVSIPLIYLSNSKTALGLALLTPFLAGFMLLIKKTMRISPAILLLFIVFCYKVFSGVSDFNMNRVSYILYGESSFTGRQLIWDYANSEIEERPLLGWGYQSFWLVGPGGPSIANAPGWVKTMPNAHNGYYDTMLEMGYVGFALLVIFITATLHVIGRVADREPARAWGVLSLALFIIIYNGLESTWMRGFEFLWVVFLVLAAEIVRYWQPVPLTRARTDRGPVLAPHEARGGPGRRFPTKPPGLIRSTHENDRK